MRNRTSRRRLHHALRAPIEPLEPRRLLAAAGDLDLGFGFVGNASTTYATGSTDDSGDAIAIVPGSGQIVVGGSIWAGGGFATLSRYHSDGTPDGSFGAGGAGGIVKFPNLPWRSVREVESLSSGVITMLSSEAAAPNKPLIHRVGSNGAPDPFWIGPGTAIPGSGVAIEQSFVLTSSAVARLRPDGTPDPAFGAGGLVTFPTGSEGDSLSYIPQALALASSGGFHVAGERLNVATGDRVAFVRRYTSTGALDTAWASGGTLLLPGVSTTDSAVRAMSAGSGSIIVVAGRSGDDSFIARFSSITAAMDSSFGTGGSGTLVFDAAPGSADFGHSLSRGPTGAMYVGGVAEATGPYIARVTTLGALDNTYDANGVIEQPLPAGWSASAGAKIGILPGADGGRIIMTTAAAPSLNQTLDQVVTRYTPAGALDTTTFAIGTGGIVRTNHTNAQSLHPMVGSVLQPPPLDTGSSGTAPGPTKTYQFGTSQFVAGNVVVTRLNVDGTLDTTFGAGGTAEIDLGAHTEVPLDAAVQRDGKIVLVGRADSLEGPSAATATWRHDYFVLRLNENGTRDTSFATNGVNRFQYADGVDGFFDQVAIVGDGMTSELRIITAGMFQGTSGPALPLVAQFSSLGVLNMAFGGSSTGRKLIDLPGDGERITAMIAGGALTAPTGAINGIAIAGTVDTTATNTDRFVMRLDLTTGNSSGNFGSGGVRILDAAPEENAVGLAGDPATGHIYLGGTAGSNLVLTRLLSGGQLDTTFGPLGTVSAALPAGTVSLADMRRALNGQFLFAGTATRAGTSDDDFLLMRLTSAGALDATFGTNGSVTIDMGTADDNARNVDIAPNGRIMVTGSRSSGTLTEWAAARVMEQEIALNVVGRSLFPNTGIQVGLDFPASDDVATGSANSDDLLLFNLTTGQRFKSMGFGIGSPGPGLTRISWQAAVLAEGRYRVVLPVGALRDSSGNDKGQYAFDLFVANGSSAGATYHVQRHDAANIRVTSTYGAAAPVQHTIPAPDVDFGTVLYFNGDVTTAANDTITIDHTAGAMPPVSIVANGRAGSDTLAFIGASPLDAFTANSSGVTHAASGVVTTWAGMDNLALNAGAFDFTANALSKSINVAASASATFDVTQRLGALTIAGDVSVPAGGNKTILTTALDITGAGRLDLADNDMAINYAASAASPLGSYSETSGYGGVLGMVARGYNFAAWDGDGVRTSMSDAVGGVTTLGVGEASETMGLGATDTMLWNGVSIDSTTVLIKYTYAGDANLDGQIDASDYGILDYFVQAPGSFGFSSGDFNFDGFIDPADYGTIDYAIQNQGAPL